MDNDPKIPLFAGLTEEDWSHLPVFYRSMAQMPLLELELVGCRPVRTSAYVLRPYFRPISRCLVTLGGK